MIQQLYILIVIYVKIDLIVKKDNFDLGDFILFVH